MQVEAHLKIFVFVSIFVYAFVFVCLFEYVSCKMMPGRQAGSNAGVGAAEGI